MVVPFSERPYLMGRWASAVGRFRAIDLDCSLPPLFPKEQEGFQVLLEGGDVFSAVADIYSLQRSEEPILLNSLGTLQAEARALGGERDWSRRFFKYVVYVATACRARADSTLLLVNLIRESAARAALGAGWLKLCSLALDGTWILAEDGLSRLS